MPKKEEEEEKSESESEEDETDQEVAFTCMDFVAHLKSHIKHEAESIDSDAHPGLSSPRSIVDEEDDMPGDDTSQSGQFANHTGQKVNRVTAYQ